MTLTARSVVTLFVSPTNSMDFSWQMKAKQFPTYDRDQLDHNHWLFMGSLGRLWIGQSAGQDFRRIGKKKGADELIIQDNYSQVPDFAFILTFIKSLQTHFHYNGFRCPRR